MRERILEIAREILASEGLSGVSFDAIAQRLNRSKQAVLYWYPSKRDLLAAMFLPALEAEAEIAAMSVAHATNAAAAIGAFVDAVAAFHLEDLDRFRMMYLLPQTTRQTRPGRDDTALVNQVHPVTDRLYQALAAQLGGTPNVARREAMAIHAAVLGLVMMVALADALDDPLKHGVDDMIAALKARLCPSQSVSTTT